MQIKYLRNLEENKTGATNWTCEPIDLTTIAKPRKPLLIAAMHFCCSKRATLSGWRFLSLFRLWCGRFTTRITG